MEDERQPNALIDEQSLYLRQHAYNPVYWYPWGDKALQLAREENKLIFLSIGYSSCHWCHVMEEEVFAEESVGEYLNEHFICIKVDREERPDIDAVYMDALLLLRGSGGWPLNMFLTPDLKPFFGSTYMPRDEFLRTAQRIQKLHEDDPEGLAEAGSQLVEYVAAEPEMGEGGAFALKEIGESVLAMARQFDAEWGGIQSMQKFPTPVRWRFLLHYYRKTGDESAAEMLRLTLDRMADGGLQDQLGRGFHRYSVDPQWTVPHFEKMLYDNAQLAALYTEAAAVFDDQDYAITARRTLDFIVAELSDGGGLFASYDADSGGEEGTYYVWSLEELIELAGEREGAVLARVYSVTEGGNFEGASVLARRADLEAVGTEYDMSAAEVAALVERWRGPMLERRAQRVAPALDRKVVTAWNGLAISALADGYSYFGDERYLQSAVAAAAYLDQHNVLADGVLARASTDGAASGRGVLDDYAALACGLAELYSATGELDYLRHARELVDYVLEHFARPEGGFYFTDSSAGDLPVRKFVFYDSVEPSGNSLMAHALLRLAALTGEPRYYAALDEMLAAHASLLRQSGGEMAWLMDAKLKAEGPFYDVVLAGDVAAGNGAEMLKAYNELIPCNSVLSIINSEIPREEAIKAAPALEGKQAGEDGESLGYVCLRGACKSPVSGAQDLRDQLLDGWVH